MMKNKSFVIETTCDIELELSNAKVYHTDSEGRHQLPDEVCLWVAGYDPATDNDVDLHITVTKQNALMLAEKLIKLANS